MLDKEKQKVEEEVGSADAPAVVGQLKVSNDLLDFSAYAAKPSKKTEKECDKECGDDSKLTPRERAIKARKEGK
ncbi:hypothetical protein [Mycoplasmopsis primatum]|uniref:hypothetical protein n=1 Tax=Mycoplasmopsis primatum TaxID=55604 RepID=UPI000496B08E|nr:hypothetical protein [Mycoplasmopsis primatum]